MKILPETPLKCATGEQANQECRQRSRPGYLVLPVHSRDIPAPRPTVGRNLIAVPFNNLIAARPQLFQLFRDPDHLSAEADVFLEKRKVRRLLEPHETLEWRLQPFQVIRRD